MVQAGAQKLGFHVEVNHLPNPRVESEQHYYNAKHAKLIDLGLMPHLLSDSLLDSLMNIAVEYRNRIESLRAPAEGQLERIPPTTADNANHDHFSKIPSFPHLH
jgi:hypothetical protein